MAARAFPSSSSGLIGLWLLLSSGASLMAQSQTSGPLSGITPPQQVQDCGTDEACLIQNAGVCRPTQAQITRSLEMLGIVTNAPTLMQIWGPQQQGCVLYTQSESAQEGFSSIMTEEMQSAGLSSSLMEIMQRNRVRTTCLFNSSVALSQFLQIVTEQQQGTVDLFTSDTTNSTSQVLINSTSVATCQVQRAS